MKKIKNRKVIISIVIALIVLFTIVLIKTNVLGRIIDLFGDGSSTLSYIIYDNQDDNKVKLLATIKTQNPIEYIEKEDSVKIYGDNKNEMSIDYTLAKDQETTIKIKEQGKPEVTKTIKADYDVIEETALKLENEYSIDGYKRINISKVDGFYDEYNSITYQIGKNGTWYNYTQKLSVIDYDVIENGLDNIGEDTVTIRAKLKNPTNSNTLIVEKTFDLIEVATTDIVTSESLIKAVEGINQTGTYNITVQDQTYTTRVYCFNESLDLAANTSFGTEKDVSTGGASKNMIIVKVNGDLTNSAYLTSYASKNGYGGPKGMFIYCTGDITNDGTISMTARGARAPGQNIYLWKNEDESYEYVPAIGAGGGASVYAFEGYTAGKNGSTGTNRRTGGGASGSARSPYRSCGCHSGAGSAGTSYSGGCGGGGLNSGGTFGSWMPAIYATAAEGNGGTGGTSGTATHVTGVGGVGNPGGATASKGNNGTGGLLIIYGNNITNTKNITSQGTNNVSSNASGGGSGGGSINIFHTGEYANTGTVNANGGSGGGTGGTGSITVTKIGETSSNPTLLSQITSDDYGKSINYSVDVTDQSNPTGDKVTLNNWKVFYKDESNVYIILDDYLEARLAPIAENIVTDSANSYALKYSIWASDNRTTLLNYLTTGTNWTEFASGISTATATGGSTLAQLNTSLGRAINSTDTISSSLTNYSLYVPHTEDVDGCNTYWLASPYESTNWGLCAVTCSKYGAGGTNGAYHYSSDTCGIRPVVCLPSDVTGTIGESITID